ncbi:MAG: hypothetical protein M5E90_07070 [Asgard group archaeon]|nr:hypothetical protein [Asgard group archaeon]
MLGITTSCTNNSSKMLYCHSRSSIISFASKFDETMNHDSNNNNRRILKIRNMIFKDLNHRQYFLGHEVYIRICLLDEIFKYEILDINTIIDMYVSMHISHHEESLN